MVAVVLTALILLEVVLLAMAIQMVPGAKFSPEWITALGPLALGAAGVVVSVILRMDPKELAKLLPKEDDSA